MVLPWQRKIRVPTSSLAQADAESAGSPGCDRRLPPEFLAKPMPLIRLRLKSKALSFPTWSLAATLDNQIWCAAMATMRSCARSVRT